MWNYNYSGELYHYGIKGMKWGVRRYQNKDGSLTSAGKDRYSSDDSKSKKVIDADRFIEKTKSKKLQDVSGNIMGSGELEILAVQTVAYVAFIGLYLAGIKIASSRFVKNKMKELDKNYSERSIKNLSEIKKLKSKKEPSESMKAVNKGYPSPGTTMNCTFCTAAMAMREKGYDVRAKTSATGWPTKELYQKVFGTDVVRMKNVKTKSGLVTQLKQQGNGAYGHLGVTWKTGGGHSIFYKVENGRVRLYDGQNGKEYDISNLSTSKFLNSININMLEYARFDTADPTDYILGILE